MLAAAQSAKAETRLTDVFFQDRNMAAFPWDIVMTRSFEYIIFQPRVDLFDAKWDQSTALDRKVAVNVAPCCQNVTHRNGNRLKKLKIPTH